MRQTSKNIILFLLFAVAAMVAGSDPSFAENGANGETLGAVINRIAIDADYSIPGAFSGFSYLFGIILGMSAIKKLKDHVESPQNNKLGASMKRFGAGGAFFSLPFMIDVVRRTIEGDGDAAAAYQSTGWNGASSGVGLDAMIVALMRDVFVPLQWVFGVFGYIAGIALLMIGISRMLKSEQDGPRGPATVGTLMTFLMAGALFSINSIISYFTTTMFGDASINTNGALQYTAGLGGAAAHVHAVIAAIIAFAIVVGWISLIRGFFLLRGVSEGNQQASMMSAVTHLIGGVLAINLGSVIMAVQNTLGITQYGIVFN